MLATLSTSTTGAPVAFAYTSRVTPVADGVARRRRLRDAVHVGPLLHELGLVVGVDDAVLGALPDRDARPRPRVAGEILAHQIAPLLRRVRHPGIQTGRDLVLVGRAVIGDSREGRAGGEHVGPGRQHERRLRRAARQPADEHALCRRWSSRSSSCRPSASSTGSRPSPRVRFAGSLSPVIGLVLFPAQLKQVSALFVRRLLGIDDVELVLVGERVPARLHVVGRLLRAGVQRQHQRRVLRHPRRHVLPHAQPARVRAEVGHLHERVACARAGDGHRDGHRCDEEERGRFHGDLLQEVEQRGVELDGPLELDHVARARNHHQSPMRQAPRPLFGDTRASCRRAEIGFGISPSSSPKTTSAGTRMLPSAIEHRLVHHRVDRARDRVGVGVEVGPADDAQPIVDHEARLGRHAIEVRRDVGVDRLGRRARHVVLVDRFGEPGALAAAEALEARRRHEHERLGLARIAQRVGQRDLPAHRVSDEHDVLASRARSITPSTMRA